VPFLDQKPISSPSSPDRTTAGGPFVDPRKEEIVTDVGSNHRLLINKYCIYRPMLVLPTTVFALQTDDLDISDITASWSVLKALKTPQMVIYNCGAGAGSSLGHKHLQIFPLPNKKRMPLFPSQAASAITIAQNISNVPFQHFVYKIPRQALAADVFKLYQLLLAETRAALRKANAGPDYNVIFTAEWIALIPRRTAVWGGPYGANGAGMVGMVTVPNQQQRQQWTDLRYTDYLVTLGIPIE
jgi:sulfate adenylyltransferase (ADP) / ATP adenylyltransferase